MASLVNGGPHKLRRSQAFGPVDYKDGERSTIEMLGVSSHHRATPFFFFINKKQETTSCLVVL